MALPPSTIGPARRMIDTLTAEVEALRARNERLAGELHAAERRAREAEERAERAERRADHRYPGPHVTRCNVCGLVLGRGNSEYETTDGRKWCGAHVPRGNAEAKEESMGETKTKAEAWARFCGAADAQADATRVLVKGAALLERAKIVAWLRNYPGDNSERMHAAVAAHEIETGKHEEGP